MKQTAFLALWLMSMASPFAAYAKDYDLTGQPPLLSP